MTTNMLKVYAFMFLFTCLFLTIAGGKLNCRKLVHHPACRGIAAKRDVALISEENALPFDQRENLDMDRNAINNYLLLAELFGRNIDKINEET